MIQPRDNVIQAFRSQNRTPALVVAGLSLVALALAVLIGRDVFFPTTPAAAAIRTANVTRGTVRSSVTGTGSVVPATQVNVGFRSAGQLTEVDVKVGDHVSKGQVLARIDTRALQIALDQANANLQTAQANLSNTVNGNSLVQAQHNLDNARTSYGDAVNQVNLTNQQDAAQLAADQAQYNTDYAQLTQDQSQYNTDYAKQQQDQANLNASATYQADKTKLATDQTQLLVDQGKYTLDGCATAGSTAQCQTDFNKIQQDQYNISQDQATLAQDQAAVNADTTAVNGDSVKVAADQAKVNGDQAKVSADQNKAASDQLNGQRSINQAQNAITSAQDAYNAQSVSRPNTIAGQQSAVQNAQSGVDTAQLNLDNATLAAPMDGVVNSLNGQVGEFVSASGGTTAQAPGSSAPLASSSTGSGSATSSAFTVLSNDQAFQVVVPFAEADAGRIVSGLSATVGFDAVQGLSVPSHVLATAATATVTSNVVNYNATLTLEQTDKRIRSGQTANVTVVVAQASNVLVVPNAAITRIGQRAFVTMLQPDGKQVRTLVTLGVAGDSSTEVSSGVKEGDKVVLPQLRASTTTTGRGTGAGAGGGGGVRIGGGG